MKNKDGPKILLLDIETAPMLAHVWGLWDQNVSLNQIKQDWHVLSWSAKWLGEKEIMYQDQSKAKNIEDDKKLLQDIWNLINEADILLTQNGIDFDLKKLNARFVINGMGPPSAVRHIDTLKLAKKHFAFTSNKLEYMTDKLCKKHKKMKAKKFPGFELWKACLAGNKAAWAEMKQYNKMDVLSLEELYHKIQPWDSSINFDAYSKLESVSCNCGSSKLQKRGISVTNTGRFQRYQCMDCGAWKTSKVNLLSKDKKKSLRVP